MIGKDVKNWKKRDFERHLIKAANLRVTKEEIKPKTTAFQKVVEFLCWRPGF